MTAQQKRVLTMKKLLRRHGMTISDFAKRYHFHLPSVSYVINHCIGPNQPPTRVGHALIWDRLQWLKRQPLPAEPDDQAALEEVAV